jgi:hypothetical protein
LGIYEGSTLIFQEISSIKREKFLENDMEKKGRIGSTRTPKGISESNPCKDLKGLDIEPMEKKVEKASRNFGSMSSSI